MRTLTFPRVYLSAFVVLAVCLSPLTAAPIALIDPGDADNSGWTASLFGAATGITTVEVDLDESTVNITIEKDFGPYEVDDGEIEFPIAKITFNQVLDDDNTVSRIIIDSESIDNNTGAAWTQFEWLVVPTGAAAFNTGESAGWNVSPFASSTFVDSNTLKAFDGTIANGATFSPSGGLVIDIDLSASGSPIAFDLKQRVVPEPTCLAMLVLGAAAILRRRTGH